MQVALIFNKTLNIKTLRWIPPPYDENAPVIRSLIEKYRNTGSRGEQIRILTIFADSWSHRKIMEKFGCSQRMATQAKHLVLGKGILSTPNPKMGKALSVEITEMVISFYKEDDINRPMPGKKTVLQLKRMVKKLKFRKN